QVFLGFGTPQTAHILNPAIKLLPKEKRSALISEVKTKGLIDLAPLTSLSSLEEITINVPSKKFAVLSLCGLKKLPLKKFEINPRVNSLQWAEELPSVE